MSPQNDPSKDKLTSDSTDASSPTNDQEVFDALIEQAGSGSEVEQSEALEELYRRANESNMDPVIWNNYGMGLHNARQFDLAINVFSMLVETFPDRDIYRLSLATEYSQIGQFDMCKYHLRHLAEHGTTEESRRIGIEQLEGMEKFLKQTKEDNELRQLQLDGLRESISSGAASAEDFVKFTRLLLMLERIEPGTSYLEEATQALEIGQRLFPESVPITEHLVLCYARSDPNGKMDATLERLEVIAPDSPAIKILHDIDSNEAEEFVRQNEARAFDLMKNCQSDDPKLVASALDGLQRMVNFYQDSSHYRTIYAFALMISGRLEEARKQAEIVAAQDPQTHSENFNLGQVFWACGDEEKGRHYLAVALQSAHNEEERQDVLDRLADLESRK